MYSKSIERRTVGAESKYFILVSGGIDKTDDNKMKYSTPRSTPRERKYDDCEAAGKLSQVRVKRGGLLGNKDH